MPSKPPSPNLRTLTAFAAMILLPATTFGAQVGGGSETLFQWDGALRTQLGFSTSSAGDVNGDGVDDLIVGAPADSPGGLFHSGSAYVYSGLDGSLIHQLQGLDEEDHFGRTVCGVGDVNADGFADVGVGALWASPGGVHGAGSAFVFSGANGTLLHRWDGVNDNEHFSSGLAGAGDLNQDGFDDVLVGARYAHPGGVATHQGSAFAFSGADGSIIHRWDGVELAGYHGESVSGIGDLDADGVPDVLVGAAGGSNSVFVYSGQSGSVIYQLSAGSPPSFYSFGNSVVNAGDVDGDGIDDLIVGADRYSPSNRAYAGSAFVFSGASGTLLYGWQGNEPGDEMGNSVSGAGDVDGDGFADLLVGASSTDANNLVNSGSVYLFAGADGSLLHQWDGQVAGGYLGYSVSNVGDLNGDGYSELITGANLAEPGGLFRAGSAYVFSFSPFLYSDTREVSAATGAVVNLNHDFPTQAGFDVFKVLISATGAGPTNYGVEIPLTQDSLTIQTFLGNYPFATHTNMHGTLDINGQATSSLTLPAGLPSSLIGRSFYVASIANQLGQLPEYSSAVVVIHITP